MKELLDASIAAETVERINKLRSDTKPLWGKMNVGQMLSHLQVPLKSALGELKLKKSLMGFLFGRIAKKQLFTDKPFKENLPTDPSFKRTGEHDFMIEKNRLLDLIGRFVAAGPAGVTLEPHPFFGKLTTTEWSTFMWKHLDHHLRQFGV